MARRCGARRPLHFAVVAHEMGHSVGLRHNFMSSSDAFNYRAQSGNCTRTTVRTGNRARGRSSLTASCVGPRYLDPLNQNEQVAADVHALKRDGLPGRNPQDFVALGAYDFAATRLFYANAVSVFADPSYASDQPRGVGALDKMDNFGGMLGLPSSLGKGNAVTRLIRTTSTTPNSSRPTTSLGLPRL